MRDYSQLAYFDRMAKGEVKGYFLFGQNPGGGGPNAGLHRAGLRNLDWLVVVDWFEIESAVFWKSDPTGPPPAEIKTEVFFFPAAAAPEKEGSLTNTQRLLQWHDKAIDPLGDSRSDAWFLYNLGKRLKAALRRFDRPQGPAAAPPHLGLRFRRTRRVCPTARSAGSRASRTWKRSSRRSTVTMFSPRSASGGEGSAVTGRSGRLLTSASPN